MSQPADAAGAAFTLRCLGPVALTDSSGRRLAFRTRKQMALLMVLVGRAGKSVGREQLVDLLWSEDESRAARHSLAQSISLINKVLATEAISFAGKDQVCLREGLVAFDVDAFERAAREGRAADAEAAWCGMLVEGLWVRRAPNFDRWVESERERLRRIRRQVLHTLVTEERRSGRWADMRARAEGLLEDDALDETAMLAWLEAVTLGGDRSLALRRYGEFEERLRDDLGADPGEGLRVWARQNRRGDAAPGAAALPRVGETIALPTVQPVYGRESEYAVLWEAWEAAGRREGSFVILEGASGIGKSTLATKLVNQVHVAGGSVCYVRCFRTEKAVPFAPITALTRQLSRLPGFVALESVWIGELSRLVPELRVRFPGAPAPMAVDDSARLRICDAMLQAAQCVADEQPLMIVVDDIQDADEATLALLHYFGRQTPGSPNLLLCVARPNAAQTELERNFFETARHAGFARFVFLGALAAEPTWRLLRHVLAQRGLDAPDWVLTRLHEITEGIPLHAIEAAMALPAREQRVPAEWEEALRVHLSPGGENFDRSAADRLAALSAEARCVAGVLAVAARPLTDYELTAVSELPATDLASAVFVLETANFVRRSGGQLTFAHERYLASSLAELPDDQRRDMHARLAELLTRSAAENPAARYEVAQHFEQAGRVTDAHEQAMAAARDATALGANRERARALAMALRLSPTDNRVRADLGWCLLDLRAIRELREHLADSTAMETDRDFGVELRILSAACDHHSGSAPLSHTYEELSGLLHDAPSFPRLNDAFLLLIRAADKCGRLVEARRATRDMRKRAALSNSDTSELYCCFGAAYVVGQYYRPDKSIPLFLRTLVLAQSQHNWEVEMIARDGLGAMYRRLGQFDRSIEQLSFLAALAKRTLNPQSEAGSFNNIAAAEIALARFRDAEAHLNAAIKLAQAFPDWAYQSLFLLNRGELRVLVKDYAGAESDLERAFAHSVERDMWPVTVGASGLLALCAARQGRPQAVRMWCNRLRRHGAGREHSLADRYPIEAGLAWELALCDGNHDGAIEALEVAAKSLSVLDKDHWLRVEVESVRIKEDRSGTQDRVARARIRGLAAIHGALVVGHELGPDT